MLTVDKIQVAVNTVYLGFDCHSGININKCTRAPSSGKLAFLKEIASFPNSNSVILSKVSEALHSIHDGSNKNYIRIITNENGIFFCLCKWEP
jgi:hypothetical protein